MKQLKTLIDKIGRDRLTILLIGGLLLMVISIPTNPKKNSKTGQSEKIPAQTTTADRYKDGELSGDDFDKDYAAYLENKLQKSLRVIDGAGQVRVMVTLHDAGGCVVEKDIAYERENESKKNAEGEIISSTRSSDSEKTVFTVDENGNSVPLISKQILPSVEGILIVAQGGDNAKVKSEMKRAVLSLFNLDEHKISIVKMKGKNG